MLKEFKYEDKFQAAAFQWTWNTYPELRLTFFRVKNEGKKNIKVAMKDKSMGIIAGIPDLVFMTPRMGVELKVKGGRQLPSQEKVEYAWGANEIEYYIVWTMDEYQELVRRKVKQWKESRTV